MTSKNKEQEVSKDIMSKIESDFKNEKSKLENEKMQIESEKQLISQELDS